MSRHWWYRGRRVAVASLARRAGVRPGGRRRVLDYGCGTGNMGGTLAAFGEVWGVEAAAEALEHGRFDRYAGVVCAASMAEAELPEGSFGLISCLDVIEHVDDDGALLRQLAARLEPDGVLLLAAPMDPRLYSGMDEAIGHRRRYTRESLFGTIHDAGLEPLVACGYVVALLPLARAHRRRIQQGRARPEEEWKVPAAPLNVALSGIAMGEGLLARWVSLPLGLSLIVAARRRTASPQERAA